MTDHLSPLHYPDETIRRILRETARIAMVGASANWNRPSYFAMKYLQARGYSVIPVNPVYVGQEILGETVYPDLASIPGRFEMVDVFRASDQVPALAEQAVSLREAKGIRFFWMQLGVISEPARAIAEAGGLEVVMDRCPKIEFGRLCRELSWGGFNSGLVSARRQMLRMR